MDPGSNTAGTDGVAALPIKLRPPPAKTTAAKKFSLKQALGFGGIALLGGAAGYLGARFGADAMLPLPHKLYQLVLLAALPAVWLLVVGFHELGHLVGGWLTGGRFLLWVVGPCMIRRTPAGLKFAWNRSLNVAGGMASCLPLEPGRVTPRRAAVMIVGGPVFSLLLAGGALWLAAGLAELPDPVPLGRALAQHVTLVAAGLSLVIFVVTAIPGIAGGFKTDGKRVFDLLRGDRRAEQEAAVMLLTTANLGGVRPADYDPALVTRAVALRDGSLFDLYGHLTVYYRSADNGDWPQAQDHLDRVLAGEDRVVPLVRDMVRCEYAWLLSTAGGPAAAALARAWLDSAGRLDFDPATRHRAEAAVLLAEGKPTEAAAKAREGLHALEHRSLSPVKNLFAAEALEAIRDRAQPG